MSSKHYIRVGRPPAKFQLYFWQADYFFPQFLAFDGTKSCNLEFSFIKTEKLVNSKIKDSFHNRNVSHSYIEADVNLTQLGVNGLSIVETPGMTIPGSMYDVVINGSVICQYGPRMFPDLSKDPRIRRKIVAMTLTSRVDEIYYPNGELSKTIIYTLLSSPPTNNPNGTFVMKVRQQTKWSYYARHNDVYTLVTVPDEDKVLTYPNQQLVFVGNGTNTYLPTDTELLKRLGEFKLPDLPDEVLADTFFDDLLSHYALPDVNNVENLKDLHDIKKSIPPIVKLLKRRDLKSFADCYLWYKYTYSTTKLDIMSYYQFIKNWIDDCFKLNAIKHVSITYSKSNRSEKATGSVISRYNVYSDTYNCGVLRTLGLDLSLSTVWDLIPFSFVADWFINFGDILKFVDNDDILSKIKVHSVLASHKKVYSYYPLSELGLDVEVRTVSYNRKVLDNIPIPDISVSFKNPVRHLGDGLALIISRK